MPPAIIDLVEQPVPKAAKKMVDAMSERMLMRHTRVVLKFIAYCFLEDFNRNVVVRSIKNFDRSKTPRSFRSNSRIDEKASVNGVCREARFHGQNERDSNGHQESPESNVWNRLIQWRRRCFSQVEGMQSVQV